LLDAMIGRPLDTLIEELGLPADIRTALGGSPQPATPLQSIYNLCLACERADSAHIAEDSSKLHVSPDQVSDSYLDALTWSEELYQEAVR
jgi:c-di-GMP-related signal transduction protein